MMIFDDCIGRLLKFFSDHFIFGNARMKLFYKIYVLKGFFKESKRNIVFQKIT